MPIDAMRRAWMEVDCRALRANYASILQRIPAGCGVLPMVKADGYGVGAAITVGAVSGLGPMGLGVATAAEGLDLRRDGWSGRILVFTPVLPADLPQLRAGEMEPVVSSARQLRGLTRALAAGEAVPAVHVEVDTGMNRFGLSWRDVERWLPFLEHFVSSHGTLASVFTHFHSAETDRDATGEQLARYRDVLATLAARGVDPGERHVANSAGVTEYSGVAFDFVRLGVWLYGAEVAGRRPEPVATVRARVLDVRCVERGDTVGYGATWRAEQPAEVAVLAIGYADGLPRVLSGRGRALLRGRPAPIRGIISMDSTVVDVTGRDDVRAGDSATLLGRDGDDEITAEELAGLCDTIAYEILTGWSARVPRIAIDGDD